VIPDWHPAKLNALYAGHWARRARLKKADRELVGIYARQAAIPPATGKRRVQLVLTLAPRQRAGDPDAYWKSMLDALTATGLLVDDNRQHVELAPVEFERGRAKATTILLADVPEVTEANARRLHKIRDRLTDLGRPERYRRLVAHVDALVAETESEPVPDGQDERRGVAEGQDSQAATEARTTAPEATKRATTGRDGQ